MQTFCSATIYSFACAALLLQGCTNKSSSTGGVDGSPVPTSQMHFHAWVEAHDASTAVVSVHLDDGRLFGDQYRLDGGDYLRACVVSQCRNLVEDFSILDTFFPFFANSYANSFTYLADTDYVISFNRLSGGNAPYSRVSLPQAFDIYAPVGNQQVTDHDVVQVGWLPTGAGDLVNVSSTIDCTQTDGLHTKTSGPSAPDIDGDGVEDLRIDDAIAAVRRDSISLAPIHHCDFTIVVKHERPGTVDSAFYSGDIVGTVARQVVVRYVPSR